MGDINSEEYARWEEGFSDGFESAIDILKVAKKFEDTGFQPERILQDKLDSLKN